VISASAGQILVSSTQLPCKSSDSTEQTRRWRLTAAHVIWSALVVLGQRVGVRKAISSFSSSNSSTNSRSVKLNTD